MESSTNEPVYSTVHHSYCRKAFGSPDELILNATRALRGVDFDTFVGRGLSGTLVVPVLARAMGKFWAISRKNDGSHSSYRIEGTMGRKWIFVDDFMQTGNTRRLTMDDVIREVHGTTFIGSYLYETSRGFIPADTEGTNGHGI